MYPELLTGNEILLFLCLSYFLLLAFSSLFLLFLSLLISDKNEGAVLSDGINNLSSRVQTETVKLAQKHC